MKKLMFAIAATAALISYAEEAKETELEKVDAPVIWGFGNTGIYSGYQLYGSLVNSEPTWQTYLECNANLPWEIGYLGAGLWFNSDLTDRRRESGGLGRMFNEYDPNIHFGHTFWFDDNNTWGLDYRTTVVWYYYPPCNYHGASHTATTMDWNHSFAVLNPYVVPFLDVVHEYHESDANLLQFGLKRDCAVTDDFSLTPSLTFVWRNSHYNWCFPTRFGTIPGGHGSGLATMKIGLDANYRITQNFGVFAKVAYCSILDSDLRNNCDDVLHGADYGDKKDFAWGGVGVSFNF